MPTFKLNDTEICNNRTLHCSVLPWNTQAYPGMPSRPAGADGLLVDAAALLGLLLITDFASFESALTSFVTLHRTTSAHQLPLIII